LATRKAEQYEDYNFDETHYSKNVFDMSEVNEIKKPEAFRGFQLDVNIIIS
tara:strand:- start:193 stop:345 length:153 start_codon:yes stop_codon:yes gene_type:complete